MLEFAGNGKGPLAWSLLGRWCHWADFPQIYVDFISRDVSGGDEIQARVICINDPFEAHFCLPPLRPLQFP